MPLEYNSAGRRDFGWRDKLLDMPPLEPTLTNFVTLDLLLWRQQGSLHLSPKFQRRAVWRPAARSYLVDTMLRGFPIPAIHINLTEDRATGARRDVIDGQQRLRAVFDFMEGNLRLSRTLDAAWAGRTFEQLDTESQSKVKMYKFHIYQYQDIDDETVLQIFSRINLYSAKVNAQELRNGRWFGQFKQAAYELGLEYLTFWRQFKIFTEGSIARMAEAELVSELLVLELDGLQDKKSSLDSFYGGLDDEWGKMPRQFKFRNADKPDTWLSREQAVSRFRSVMAEIGEATGSILATSAFRRVPLFQTLYTVVYHRVYGVPSLPFNTPKKSFTGAQRKNLRLAIGELSDLLSDKPDSDDFTGWRRDFIIAASRQTDNIGPRLVRAKRLWEMAELA